MKMTQNIWRTEKRSRMNEKPTSRGKGDLLWNHEGSCKKGLLVDPFSEPAYRALDSKARPKKDHAQK